MLPKTYARLVASPLPSAVPWLGRAGSGGPVGQRPIGVFRVTIGVAVAVRRSPQTEHHNVGGPSSQWSCRRPVSAVPWRSAGLLKTTGVTAAGAALAEPEHPAEIRARLASGSPRLTAGPLNAGGDRSVVKFNIVSLLIDPLLLSPLWRRQTLRSQIAAPRQRRSRPWRQTSGAERTRRPGRPPTTRAMYRPWPGHNA